jgi:hypothetical protein
MLPLQGWPVIPGPELFELKRRQDAGERIFTCEWRVLTGDEMRAIVKDVHNHGMTVGPYLAWGTPNRSDEYKTWGEELICDPMTGIGCDGIAGCWNSANADAMAGLLRDRIKDLDIDGFRTDAGFMAALCNSAHHAHYGSECGWTDDDGKLQSSRNLFSARRMAQRAYRLFHGGVKADGVCVKHIYNGTRYDAILGHTDSVMSAEGAEMKARSLKEFPLEFYRASVMGDPHGWQVSYMAKAEKVGADARLGMCVLHNLNPRGGHEILKGLTTSYSRSSSHASASGIWAAREWIAPYERGLELWGYWKNAKLLDTGHPDVKGTLYVRRGDRILLGLQNLGREGVESAVRIDLKALGFDGKVFAYDPLIHEEIAIDGGSLKLALTSEGFRLVQIASKPFDVFVPEKVGPNLVAEINESVTPDWRASQYVDERKPQPPTPNDLRYENGVLVIEGRGDNFVGLAKTLATTTSPGKAYMFEADAHVDAGDGAFLGENVDLSFFWISFGETSNYNHDFRIYGSQMPPNYTEKVRLYFVRGEAPLMVDFRMRLGKGKATLKNIGVYEIKSAPEWCKRRTGLP